MLFKDRFGMTICESETDQQTAAVRGDAAYQKQLSVLLMGIW